MHIMVKMLSHLNEINWTPPCSSEWHHRDWSTFWWNDRIWHVWFYLVCLLEVIYWVRCGVKCYGYAGVWVKLWMSLKFYNINMFQGKIIIHTNQTSCCWFPLCWQVTAFWFAWGVTTLRIFRSIWVRFILTLALRFLSRSIVMVASVVSITIMLVRLKSAGIIITLLLCVFLFISLSAPRLCPLHPWPQTIWTSSWFGISER